MVKHTTSRSEYGRVNSGQNEQQSSQGSATIGFGGFSVQARWLVAGLLACGAIMRIIWVKLKPPQTYLGEAHNVAVSIAQGRGFGNALGPDSGPTLHMTPSMTLIAGAVYRILGVDSFASQAVLTIFSLCVVLGGYLLLYALFGVFGVPRKIRLIGLAVVTLAPSFWTPEAIDFQTLEGGLAVLLLITLLYKQSSLENPVLKLKDWLGIAFISGVLFAVSPTVASGGLVASALLLMTKARPRRWIGYGSLFLLIILIVQMPWMARNQAIFGRPIISRGNDGLEMSIAYYPGAADAPMSVGRYWARINQIHPYDSPKAYAKMKEMGGELPYYDMLRRQVREWIANHPKEAAYLTARHIKEFMIPDRWQFEMKNSRGLETIRFLTVFLVCCIGYVSAVTSFRWLPRGRYAAVATLVIPFAYAIVEPIPRYMWVTYGLLTFWSVAGIWAIYGRAKRSRKFQEANLPEPTSQAVARS